MDKTLRARERFEKAVELDPDYAAAYSGLADSIMLLFINHAALPMDEAFALSQEALDKALQLDSSLADAYASLGLLKTTVWTRASRTGTANVRAEAAYQKALEISPNHARATMWFASLRAAEQKIEEAIALYRRSLEIDPLARIPYANMPGMYAVKGHNAEALSSWLDGVDIYPEWPTIHANIAVHLQALGRTDESIAWAKKSRELSSDPLTGLNAIPAYLELGDIDSATSMMLGLDLAPTHPLAKVGESVFDYFNGDYQKSLEKLERSITDNESIAPFMYRLISRAALFTGDYDKAYRYTLEGNPALSDLGELVVDQFNTADAVMLAFILQQRGEHDAAGKLLTETLSVLQASPRLGMAGHGVRDAQVMSLQGRQSDALGILQQAVDEGYRGSMAFDVWRLEEDPYFVSLRDDPRFASIQSLISAFNAVMLENVRQAELFNSWDDLRARARKPRDVTL